MYFVRWRSLHIASALILSQKRKKKAGQLSKPQTVSAWNWVHTKSTLKAGTRAQFQLFSNMMVQTLEWGWLEPCLLWSAGGMTAQISALCPKFSQPCRTASAKQRFAEPCTNTTSWVNNWGWPTPFAMPQQCQQNWWQAIINRLLSWLQQVVT